MEFNATFVVTIISFIAFVFLMNAILYKPLEKIVDEREKLISDNYQAANDADSQAKSLLEKKAQTIAEAKAKAKAAGDKKLKEEYQKSTQKLKEEKANNLNYISEQKDELNASANAIEADLSENIYRFADMIKDKLFGRNTNG